MRSGNVLAPSSPVSGRISTNSSPPYLANVSISRICSPTRSVNSREHGVAALVPVAVVDLLEVVEVEHHHGEVPAEPQCALDLATEVHRQVAVVPPTRQRIGDGEQLRLAVLQRVVDGDARLVGQRPQRVLVGLAEGLPVEPVVGREHPDDVLVPPQRHRQHVPDRRLAGSGQQRLEPAARDGPGGRDAAEHPEPSATPRTLADPSRRSSP